MKNQALLFVSLPLPARAPQNVDIQLALDEHWLIDLHHRPPRVFEPLELDGEDVGRLRNLAPEFMLNRFAFRAGVLASDGFGGVGDCFLYRAAVRDFELKRRFARRRFALIPALGTPERLDGGP